MKSSVILTGDLNMTANFKVVQNPVLVVAAYLVITISH